MIKKKKTIFYNFNEKHKEYIRATNKNCYNIAEGSIRSGKTTDNVLCFAHDIKKSKDKIHLATASTQPTAKLIIGDCDGFGLEHIFRGQCRWGKYKGNECLIIKGPDTNYKEKIVLFCGGAKADSYKKFRGTTIGVWIATEIDLHHDETIKEALKRQINADRKKLYWDLNPGNPYGFIYSDYIDDWKEKSEIGTLLGGYNYQTFNIFDNINIPKKNLDEVLSRYTPGSVFYKRDILGQRCAAEGIIYGVFAENKAKFITDKPDFDFINIGVDFGGNGSAHAFCATGIKSDHSKITVLSTERHPATGLTPNDLYDLLEKFVNKVEKKYGAINFIYADSAEQTLINGIKSLGIGTVKNSIKNPILDRIRCTTYLMSSGRFFMTDDCKSLEHALESALYNPKSLEDERLDDGTTDIDDLDACEYSWERYLKQLSRD